MGERLILPEPALIGLVAGLSFLIGMVAMAMSMYYNIKSQPYRWIRMIRREMIEKREAQGDG